MPMQQNQPIRPIAPGPVEIRIPIPQEPSSNLQRYILRYPTKEERFAAELASMNIPPPSNPNVNS